MTDLERLDVDAVVEMNQDLCGETDENSALLDPGGLDAAVERPWSGFGDFEAFPTLYDKAAALLHGIASRQVFENGNKRTAWVAAVTLLDINNIDIGLVETSHSDMFVRAAGLDRSLEVANIAEWFRVTHRQAAEPKLTAPRSAISLVGSTFIKNDDDSVAVRGFQFISPIAHEHPIEVLTVDGVTEGWTVEELHVVSHGRPCALGAGCPLA